MSRQTPHRQRHLNIANFASLDIVNPRQIGEISYRDDGTPVRRSEAKASLWSAQCHAYSQHSRDEVIPNLNESTSTIENAARHFEGITAGESSAEVLQEARDLLQTSMRARKVAVSSFEQYVKASKEMEKDIKGFIDEMEKVMKALDRD